MRIESPACSVALIILLGGCAIHPQPRDVTGVSTYEIVQQIRCETREAVISSALDYLTKGDVDPASREEGLRLKAEYAANPDSIAKLNPMLFKGEVRKILSVFWTTGVAYNFKLDMTEVNNLGGELDFIRALSKGVFGLILRGGFDRTRQNVRTFTVTDNFGELVQRPTRCDGRLVGPNYVYPITGRIGVDEVVHAFVFLTLFGNLGGDSGAPGAIPKGPPTLADALQFTTTISGSANPRVDFAPIGRTLSVSHADLNVAARRTDKHQVIVGLALAAAAQAQLGSIREGLRGRLVAPVPPALFGRLLTASGTPAELAAANAVDQVLTQQLFSPTITITP